MKCKRCEDNKPILFHDGYCGICLIYEYDLITEQVNKWESDYDTTLDALNKEIAENKRLKAIQIMLEQEIERLKYTLTEGQNDDAKR